MPNSQFNVADNISELPDQLLSMSQDMDASSNSTMEESGDTGVAFKVRRNFNKKPLNSADRKKNEKERKARQARRLRKWLMPKNAIVALHELLGPGMTEFTINTQGQETKAEIVINNVKYEATAANKNLAKAKASEKALRELTFAQMARVKQQRQDQAQQKTAGDSASDVTPMDVCVESEDLPMEHLASFALHKLFTQWEAEGFEVPLIKPGKVKGPPTPAEPGAPNPLLPKVTKTIADLPADAATRHPTALFAYMRPQVLYEDLGCSNDQTNREFSVGINVDGQQFVGKDRSKKLARKAAAIDACKTLFGVQFAETALKD
ncbi:double-stranded RNA-specific editase B2-like [Anopheles nili]|uniref:double-stranded RNA-specific editase B2-like n=1 Tax=Anopheles nili TaxID=185578 RepID=UPI00237ACF62|nr:double-stranded RNA-specific editase B2-like [Anopheles nili]